MKKGRQHEVITASFRNTLGFTITAGTPGSVNVSPNATLSARMAALADNFDEYKCSRLRYRVRPYGAAGSSTGVAMAFYPGITDNAPLYASLLENLHAAVLTTSQTTCSEWQSIPPATLQGMHPWYKTVPGASESAEELQGTIYLDASANTSWVVDVEGDFIFRAPASAAATPADRALAAQKRERKRLMALLVDPSGTTAGKK